MLIGDSYEIADSTTYSNNTSLEDDITITGTSGTFSFDTSNDEISLRVDALTNVQDQESAKASSTANTMALASALDAIEASDKDIINQTLSGTLTQSTS